MFLCVCIVTDPMMYCSVYICTLFAESSTGSLKLLDIMYKYKNHVIKSDFYMTQWIRSGY